MLSKGPNVILSAAKDVKAKNLALNFTKLKPKPDSLVAPLPQNDNSEGLPQNDILPFVNNLLAYRLKFGTKFGTKFSTISSTISTSIDRRRLCFNVHSHCNS